MSPMRLVKLLAAALVGCFSLAPAFAAPVLTIDSAGLMRKAIMVEHVPLKLARRPLVVVLHGKNGNGARIRRRLALEKIADSNKPIFLYPDALDGHWTGAGSAGVKRDVAMLRDFTERLVRQGLADPRRIYLVGASTGGAMALEAACAGLGEPIAGLATIDAAMPADLGSCEATGQVAYLDIETAARSNVAPRGVRVAAAGAAIETPDSLAAVARFAKLNACTAGPLPAPSEFSDPRRSRVVSIEQYLGCKAPVERVWIVGGKKVVSVTVRAPHDRGSGRAGKIDAGDGRLIWAFLKNQGA